VPIEITQSDVGGCSDMKRTIRAFVRLNAWLVGVRIIKKGPGMVSYFCKENIFVTAVTKDASRRTLIPYVHSKSSECITGMGYSLLD
jgi:hypothetical protein